MDDHVTLTYDLTTLPTAQHKAGLAGLVLSIQEMQQADRKRGENGLTEDDIPEIVEFSATNLTIKLTENSCRKLFDDCYRAVMGEVEVEKKWANAEIKRTFKREKKDSSSSNSKTVTVYVHPNLEPRNPMLDRYLFRDRKESKGDLWYKLWRDMLFAIPRAKPTTRNPYKETVDGGSCNEGAKMWKELVRFEKAKSKNEVRAIRLSSALLLGAQDSTAENVDFSERVDNILALHFWPLATMIYVPFLLDIDAANPNRSKTTPIGYSLAIPDIANLELFCSRFTQVLITYRDSAKAQGYRPDNACIEVAAESSIDLLTQQAWLASAKTEKVRLPRVLQAVEYMHLEKQGNNVKTLGSGRVAPDSALLKKYLLVKKRYRSPLFRSIRIAALMEREPRRWWEPFSKTLNLLPCELLLSGHDLPYFAKSFCWDVRTAFREETNPNPETEREFDMAEKVTDETSTKTVREPKTIEQIVLNMVRNYVITKTESKTNITYATVKSEIESQKSSGAGDAPKNSSEKTKFEDARHKIAERLFLEVRSRHGREFASYFAEHFGASKQYTIASSSDFQQVCDSLLKTPEDVRVVTLLALSANS